MRQKVINLVQSPGNSVVEQVLKGNFSRKFLKIDVVRPACILSRKNIFVRWPDRGIALNASLSHAVVLVSR